MGTNHAINSGGRVVPAARAADKLFNGHTPANGVESRARLFTVRLSGVGVIESRLHHCLDITLREDQSRVRTPKAARILGTIRRVAVSLANAAVNQARINNPETKHNTRSFQNRFRSARGGHERLRALIFAKSPEVLHL
jgi:hypothetical protein